MAAILVLETRAALIGTFAVVLYYIYLKFNVIKRNKTALLIIASAVVAAALFCNFYGQRLLGIVSELQTVGKGDLVTTSTGQRLYMWIKSFEMFTNNIVLGVGYSGWQSEFKAIAESENLSASFPRFNQPHNFIVDIASTTGVAGLITFMMFLFSPLYCLVRSRISAVVNNLHIGNIYVSLLIMFICLGLFDSIARMHAPFMIFVMLLAILLSYGDKSRSGDKNVA
jgi:O-antigen ligase